MVYKKEYIDKLLDAKIKRYKSTYAHFDDLKDRTYKNMVVFTILAAVITFLIGRMLSIYCLFLLYISIIFTLLGMIPLFKIILPPNPLHIGKYPLNEKYPCGNNAKSYFWDYQKLIKNECSNYQKAIKNTADLNEKIEKNLEISSNFGMIAVGSLIALIFFSISAFLDNSFNNNFVEKKVTTELFKAANLTLSVNNSGFRVFSQDNNLVPPIIMANEVSKFNGTLLEYCIIILAAFAIGIVIFTICNRFEVIKYVLKIFNAIKKVKIFIASILAIIVVMGLIFLFNNYAPIIWQIIVNYSTLTWVGILGIISIIFAKPVVDWIFAPLASKNNDNNEDSQDTKNNENPKQ
ncbi:hypothetical protein HNP89_001478 [Methanococcus maripaludis]|uniref:Uncharacterized protein n=1 Tax=Methanococcus maripaludis TaxID=39152 RepID=A0A7J9P0L9_METMI|nr:hypothetical protein [Methanococcus maripaludis]MBA2853502.1 hypothetical protein [Methanococcus maripaludis]